jgi:hypothetical protein
MHKRLTGIVLGIGVAVVAVGAFAATAGAAPTDRASDHLAVLAQPQGGGDVLPAFVRTADIGDRGLLVASTRLVGQAEGARHFAGEDKAGQVCLISVLGSTPADLVMGATCAGTAEFTEEGLTLQVKGPATATEAHLLPEGYSAAAQQRPELTVLSPNLAVSDPNAGSAAAIPLASAKGATSGLALANLPAARS